MFRYSLGGFVSGGVIAKTPSRNPDPKLCAGACGENDIPHLKCLEGGVYLPDFLKHKNRTTV